MYSMASISVVKNRIRLLLTALGVAVLAGAYFVLRWRENHGHHPAYGDVATWLTFVAAAVGIPFAVYQFALQRRQLADQQKAITDEFSRQQKRDRLLDEQLKEIELRGRIIERQQAEKIGLTFTTTVDDWAPEGWQKIPGGYHIAVVANDSHRPIWNVRCRISPEGGQGGTGSEQVGRFKETGVAAMHRSGVFTDLARTMALELIRPGDAWGFMFSISAQQYPQARMSVLFTDDADIEWRIDHDLHLGRPPTPPASV